MDDFKLISNSTGIDYIIPVIRYGVYRRTDIGWSIATRRINNNEFVLVDKGSACINIEGVNYDAGPGMLFYFHPGLVHSLRTNDKDPFSFYAVHFDYTFFESDNSDVHLIHDNFSKTRLPLASVQKIKYPGPYFETLKKAVDSFNRRLPGWELAGRISLETFIYMLFHNPEEGNINYGARNKLDEISKYINENIEKNLNLMELAKLAKVTPDYLSRIFKSYTGYPLSKYILQCKVQQAKALMMGGDLKVKEISALLGFSDEFHFSKVFKKVEGVSPRFYRKG